MSNYVIQRPEYAGYMTSVSAHAYGSGTSASAITDSNDLGSTREATFTMTSEVLTATSTNYNDAVVEVRQAGYAGELTLLLEEITSSAMKIGYTGSADGEVFEINASATTPTKYGIVVEPFYIDGNPYTAVFGTCVMTAPPERKLSRDQELLELKFQVLVNTSADAGKQFVRFIKQ